jgi:hypothetical protein
MLKPCLKSTGVVLGINGDPGIANLAEYAL